MNSMQTQPNGSKDSSNEAQSPKGGLTIAPLSRLIQTTFLESLSSTDFAESADGLSLSKSQDGRNQAPSGALLSPASHGAIAGNVSAMVMSAILLPSSSRLFPSAIHQSSLANRLQAKLPWSGLTGYSMNWKTKVTPAGRQICALVALGRPTSGSVFFGLPTPAASEHRDWSRPEILKRLDRGGRVARRICSMSSKALLNQGPVGLNPCFALKMMGFPPEWSVAMLPETPSCQP